MGHIVGHASAAASPVKTMMTAKHKMQIFHQAYPISSFRSGAAIDG
jgi:hypothetical protein